MSCNTETEFIERLLGPMEQHLEMPLKRAGKERKPTPPLQLLPRQQAKGGQQHQRQRQTVVSEARRRKQLPAEVLLHILSFVSSKRDLVSCMATNRQLYHCARKLLWRYPLFGSIHYWFRFCRLILSKAESPEAAAIANTVSVLNFSVIPVMGDRNQRSVVTDAVLGCPRVVLLNFYKCDWIDDVFMAKVASTCSVLRSVNLSYCADISDATVQALATQCPMVETLILRECVCISNKAMEAIAKSGWYLRRLNISNCKNITDAGLMWLTYDLDVQSSGQPIVSSRETANSGKRRANAFRYLTQLVTTRCSSLTNESLAAIAKGCPRLRTLGMAYLPNITDIGVRKLIEACTNLVMIDVQCCRRLTEASLVCAAGDRRLEVRHELLNRMRRIQAPAQVPEQAPAPEPIAEPMSPQPLLPPTPSFGGLVGEPSTPQDVTEVQVEDDSLSRSSDQLPLSNTSASLDVLCGSMPNMPGCSLRKLCRSGRAGIANLWFCQEFSLLADVCAKDMPGMRGCGDYTKLCKAGSVVRQCYNEPAVSYLPTTRRAKQLVLDICADMYMTGCERCGATGMCPGFEVYSDLCLSMPEMEQCDEWKRMCKAEPLLPVCPPTGDSDGSPNSRGPTMKMFFHFGYSDYVLFDFWVPRTATSYALACLACFTLAVAYEWLLALGAHLEAQWNPLMPAGGAALAAGPGGLEGVDTILAAGGTPLSPLASTSSTYSDTPLLNRPQDGGPSRRKKGGGGSSATAAAPRSKLGSSHSRQHSHGAGALVADDSGADRDLEHGAMPDESLDAGDHAHLLAGSAASQAAGHGQRSGSPPPAHRAPSSLSSTSSTSSSTTVARMSFLSRGWWLAVWPSAFLFRFFTKPTWTPLEVRLGRTVLRIVTVSGAYLCMLVIMTFNVGLFLSIVFGLGFGTFLFSEEFGRGAPSAVQPRIEKEHCC